MKFFKDAAAAAVYGSRAAIVVGITKNGKKATSRLL
jgi:hypothetical protein